MTKLMLFDPKPYAIGGLQQLLTLALTFQRLKHMWEVRLQLLLLSGRLGPLVS